MSDAMTPPTGKSKPAKKTAAPKKAASGRASRRDYGFLPGAKIAVNKEKDVAKLRGQTKEWYDRLKKSNGKTVEHFLDNNQGVTNNKGKPERPRGWLAHFCLNDYASLSGGKAKAA